MANVVKITVTAVDNASKTLKGVAAESKGLEDSLRSARVPLLATTAALTGIGFASVKAASDLQEAANKSKVTFGASAKVVDDFAKTSAESFGISMASANSYAGTLGTILNASGLAENASASMSVELVRLAADLASFNNIPIDVALEKLRSGLVGEVEPLRTVGVLLSQAEVEAYALREGMIAAGDSMTEAEKVQARYGLILEQTTSQQGDFTRTADSLANSTRILQARLSDASATLGTQLLPTATKAVHVFSDLTEAFAKTSTEMKTSVVAVGAVTGGVAALGLAIPPVITGLRLLGTTAGFAAANPLLALVAVLGTALVVNTVAGNLRAVSDEAYRSTASLNDLNEAVKALRVDAAKGNTALSEQDAQLKLLTESFEEVASAQELFTLTGAAARLSSQAEMLKGTDQYAQANHEAKKATDELRDAEKERADTVNRLIEFVGNYQLSLKEATKLTEEFSLTYAEAERVLGDARIRAAEDGSNAVIDVYRRSDEQRIADQKKSAEVMAEMERQAWQASLTLGNEKWRAEQALMEEQRQERLAHEQAITELVIEQERARAEAQRISIEDSLQRAREMAGLLPDVFGPGVGTTAQNGSSFRGGFKSAEERADELGLTGQARADFIARQQAAQDRLTGPYAASPFPTLPGMGDPSGAIAIEQGRMSGETGPGGVGGASLPGITVVVQGSIVAEDLASTIQRGLAELERRG